MSSPKRHHFVPRLVLQYFVGPNPPGRVWTYDAESGETYAATPEDTAVQGHFYSAGNSDGTINSAIETTLSQIETRAAPIYADLVRGSFPTSEQRRVDFSVFLAVSYLRTPAMRRMTAETIGRFMQIKNYAYGVHDGAFESLMRRIENETGEQMTAEARERVREDLIDPSSYVIEMPQQNTLSVLRLSNKLAPIFFQMTWVLIEAKHGFFITGDNPLARATKPRNDAMPMMSDMGFLDRTAEVTFPLSPHLMLALIWAEGGDFKLTLDRDFVDRTNELRAINSERYLYSHVHHKSIRRLAAKFRDTRPGMTTAGFGPSRYADVVVSRRRKPN